MSYLFQVSIGPVQSFIAGARRTGDLKFASSFLSRLARAAAITIRDQCGEESLIFPAQAIGAFDAPNKILAHVESGISLEELAAQIKSAIDDEVSKIRKKAFQKLDDGRFDRENAEKQIADLLEYTWAGITYSEEKNGYAIARKRLDALIAARKNTRDFAPVSWGSSQPKSSMNGELEGVIYKEEYPHRGNSKTMSEAEKEQVWRKTNTLRYRFGAGPYEKLSGVDLLKRLGPIEEEKEDSSGASERGEGKNFPSTSHMAALPFLVGLKTLPADTLQKFEHYIQKLQDIDRPPVEAPGKTRMHVLDLLPDAYRSNNYWKKIYSLGDYDGALLYPERFLELVGNAQVLRDTSELQEAMALLDDFLQGIHLRPTPYYALLMADGDSMGKIIDAQAEKKDGRQGHRELSGALGSFASQVREIIRHYEGVRIYSGGDDVLALLPLHTAVECAAKLSTKFRNTLKEFTDNDAHSPSLSAGLAIVHHLHPLKDALGIAHNAEQRAKRDSEKKNALAITLQKRGGPPCEAGGQWNDFIPRLNVQMRFCQSDLLPSGMAYELDELAQRLETDLGQTQEKDSARKQRPVLSPLHVQYAALRVFQRKLGEAGGQAKDKKERELALYALKRMVGLIGESGAAETPDQAFAALQKALKLAEEDKQQLHALRERTRIYDQIRPVRVRELAKELIIARFFADARQMAGVTSEEGENA